MDVSSVSDFDGDPEVIFEMMTEHRYQEEKCRATRAVDHSIDISGAASGQVRIVVHRTMPPDFVPESLRSFVGHAVKVVETQEWGPASAGAARRGALSVDIEGLPLTYRGTIALVRAGGGARIEVRGEVRCAVPLVGGKIAKAAAPAIRTALDAEEELIRTRLAEG